LLKNLNVRTADLLSLKTYNLLKMQSAMALQEYKQARRFLQKADEICSYDTNVLNGFVALALAQNNLDDAKPALDALRKKEAHDAQTKFNEAMFDHLSDKNELAKSELTTLTRMQDIDAFTLVKTAELLLKLDARETAQKAALRALSIDKDNRRALEIALAH